MKKILITTIIALAAIATHAEVTVEVSPSIT